MTENWWNNLEPIKDRNKYMKKEEERLVKELERLWEEIEKRILADPASIKETKRVANKYNEKEEVVLVLTVLKYFEKMGIISQRDIKDMFCGG